MNLLRFYQFLIFSVFLQTVTSIIITSVLAGRRKFKTFSFDFLLPPIVLEKANKLGFSFNGHYRFQKPNFRIKFNMPLKFPIHMNYANNYDEIDEHETPPPTDYNGLGMPDASAYDADQGNDQGQQYQTIEGDHVPEYHDSPQKSHEPLITLHGKPGLNGNIALSAGNHHSNSYNNQDYQYNQQTQINPDYSASNSVNKLPYTGKAQVSSFIDNGKFINAHPSTVVMRNPDSSNVVAASSAESSSANPDQDRLVDEAFEDQLEGAYGKTAASENSGSVPSNDNSDQSTSDTVNEQLTGDDNSKETDEGSRREDDIRRTKGIVGKAALGKLMVAKKVKMLKVPLFAKKLILDDKTHIHTVRLGYKGAPAHSSFLTKYEATPDAVPLSLPRSKYSNYYSSLTFTNGMHGIPYDPVDFGPFGTIKWLGRLFNKPGIVVPSTKYRLPAKHINLG